MSTGRDDELERDMQPQAGISAAYRTRSAESPPAEVDARILAAAHRAVGSRPQTTARGKFRFPQLPLATAAVLMLSATLLLMMHDQGRLLDLSTQVKQEDAAVPAAPAVETMQPPQTGTVASRPLEAESDVADSTAPAAAAASETATNGATPPPSTSPAAAAAASVPAAAGAKLESMPDPSPSEPASPDTSDLGTAGTPAQMLERDALQGAIPEPQAPATSAERAKALPAPAPYEEETLARERQSAAAAAQPESEKKTAPPPQAFPARDERERGRANMQRDDETRVQPLKDQAATEVTASPPAAPAPAMDAATEMNTRSESAAGEPMLKRQAFQRTPEQWLEEIRRLQKEGKLAEAHDALIAFRKQYPDYRLPPDIDSELPLP